MQRFTWVLRAAGAAAVLAPSCSLPPRDEASLENRPNACPRDAHPGRDGACICEAGRVVSTGACVLPVLADAFCGRGARADPSGCVFSTCGAGQGLDATTGECVLRPPSFELETCPLGRLAVIENGHTSCVPMDAACPRGTRSVGTACSGDPCPPGSLSSGGACQSVVRVGQNGRTVVDVGKWIVSAIGVDGGPGSASLCQPLALRPALFETTPQKSALHLRLDITLSLPDRDVSALVFRVVTSAGGRPLPADADSAVLERTAALLELLRGLGGESSTAAATVGVTCTIGGR